MLFNSLQFPVFLALFLPLYFALRGTARLVWVFVASCYFYAFAIPEYLPVLVALIGLDYAAGLLVATSRPERRKAYLVLSLAANLLVLGIFKYYNFFVDNLQALFAALSLDFPLSRHPWVLPVGLSFHTFQSMAYVIEVYRERQPPERNLLVYANYVLFWPQLVAGPIERPQNLLSQFRVHHRFEADRAIDGLRLTLVGFFKKVVIADNIAPIVDQIFRSPGEYAGLPVLVGVYFFAFQIFCDFSGYTDIARGLSRLMGFHLCENFRSPYLAASITDFWRRWHISLSGWFRDYLYIPLGGNRVSTARHRLNLMIVFVVSGLWHGANWTFVVWGGLHGLFLLCGRWLDAGVAASRARHWISVVVTFHLVCLAWIFFRADSLGDAGTVLVQLFRWDALSLGDLSPRRVVVGFALIAGLWLAQARAESLPPFRPFEGIPRPWRLALYYALILAVVGLGDWGDAKKFIYFQF